MIPQILILASELIEKPPPVGWFVETTGSLQLTEPLRDKLLWVEGHRLARATLSHIVVPQDSNGRWIETEEVEPPAIWAVAFEAVEEGAMAVVEQALTKVLAIATQGNL